MKWMMIILVVFLSGCVTPGVMDEDVPIVSCDFRGSGKGVEAVFIPGSPPLVIRGGKDFSLGVKFVNNFGESKNVEFNVQDNTQTPLDGFDEGVGISQSVGIDGAEVEKGRWINPGCRLTFGGGLAELNLGRRSYRNVLSKEDVVFTGTLKYEVDVDAPFGLCIFNPAYIANPSCRDDLGLGVVNSHAPVSVAGVNKRISGGEDFVDVELDIEIRKMANGRVGDMGEVDFMIEVEGVNFECESEQSVGFDRGDNLILNLKEGNAQVYCYTQLFVDREQKFSGNIMLYYPYVYNFLSKVTLEPNKVV